METYAPAVAVAVTGLKPVTLRQWHLRGLLDFEQDPGTWRRYSFDDLLAIVMMAAITEAGLSASHAAEIIRTHRDYFRRDDFYLIVSPDGRGGCDYQSTAGATPLAKIDLDLYTVIPVHRIREKLRRKLAQIEGSK